MAFTYALVGEGGDGGSSLGSESTCGSELVRMYLAFTLFADVAMELDEPEASGGGHAFGSWGIKMFVVLFLWWIFVGGVSLAIRGR